MTRRGPRQITVGITDLGEDGCGVGSFEGREVRARNALPSETVDVRVLKRRRGVWYGEADTPDAAADTRRAPACRFYPRCGGCALQHLDYAAQLARKERVLCEALAAAGVKARRLRSPVAGPRLHYRHKARLGVRLVGGELLAGFREGFSNRVARMDDCKTLALPFARMIGPLRTTLADLAEPDRIPQVELAAGDSDFAVVIRHLGALEARDRELLAGFGRGAGMRVFLQPAGYDSVTPLDPAQGSLLSYANADFGLCFQFHPTDFTQVNPYLNRLLVRDAVLALGARPGERVTDLFCGIGNFSLALARGGARVTGLEASPGAVVRARHNAELNGVARQAEFAVADLYDARCSGLGESEYLLLDPPRSGAGPNLEAWAGCATLRRVAYVSCNPVTFASDAAVLARQGFDLEEAGIFDMFPHTAHVETLGIFSRPRPDDPHG